MIAIQATAKPAHSPRCSPSALLLHLRHDGEWATFRILEEGHPLLRSVGMLVDQVWGVDELDTAALQRRVGELYIGNAQIEDRLCGWRVRFLRQVEARATHV